MPTPLWLVLAALTWASTGPEAHRGHTTGSPAATEGDEKTDPQEPASAAPAATWVQSPDDQARFEFLKRQLLEKHAAEAAAGPQVEAMGLKSATLPGVRPAPMPGEPVIAPDAREQRRRRFDEFYEKAGTYDNIWSFTSRCRPRDGCDWRSAVDYVKGADDIVEFHDKAAAQGVDTKSPAFVASLKPLKDSLVNAMHQVREHQSETDYHSRLMFVSRPVIDRLFTPEERQSHALENVQQTPTPDSQAYLGDTLNRLGKSAEAREAFDQALKLDPKNQEALRGRALANYNLNDYAGAIRDAKGALAIDPDDKNAFATLKLSEQRAPAGAGGAAGALAASAAGPAAEAAGAMPQALSRASSIGESVESTRQAQRAMSMGDWAAALEKARRAYELNPRNAQAYALASMANSRLGRYRDALAAAEAGLRLAPRSGALLVSKAHALNRMKDHQAALAAANAALEANGRDPMAHLSRAHALAGLRDREGMLASLRSAAALDPKLRPVLDAALQLPEDADLAFLFTAGEEGASPRPARPGGSGRGRMALLLLAAVGLGGLLILGGVGALRSGRRPAPPALAMPRPAAGLLGGRYELGRQLGSGGMGLVYEGKDLALDRAVAIKRMREEIRNDPRERERFLAEARTVAALRHGNIVEIYAILQEQGEIYLVFEHIAGRTLSESIAEGRMAFAKARDIFRGVAAALDHAHGHGVIHRDLKPSNIMVDSERRARVMDFGIARLAKDALARQSVTNTVLGTPPYMAPEQEQGVVRRESDIYSLGVCLYEALTGKPPFSGSGSGMLMNKIGKVFTPAALAAPGLPDGIDAVFARVLDPDAAKRPQSAGELVRALDRLHTPVRAV